MNDQQILQYIGSGGELFSVTRIDTYRDGGTTVIQTTRGQYFIDKRTKAFHSNYPLKDDNLILDPPLKAYLIDRIERFVSTEKRNVIQFEDLLLNLKSIHSPNPKP